MRVVMPFWNLNLFHRYQPQLEAISENVDQLTLLYLNGKPKKSSSITFQHVTKPNYPKPFDMIMLIERLYKQVNEADLIYSLSGRWQQLAGTKISEKLCLPHVIRLRGADEFITLIKGTFLKKLFYHLYFKPRINHSWENATKIIPIASHLIDTLPFLLDYRKVTYPIPNGVDITHFKSTQPPKKLKIGYVGRISPEKGADFMHQLIKKTPNINYLLAGPIQTKWDPLPNANTLGNIQFNDVPKIYEQTSIVMLPSYSEGFPNIILESYASGRPILISIDALPSEAKLFGYSISHDLIQWINKVHELDLNQLEELGNAAKEYVCEYSWENYGKRMVEVFRDAVTT